MVQVKDILSKYKRELIIGAVVLGIYIIYKLIKWLVVSATSDKKTEVILLNKGVLSLSNNNVAPYLSSNVIANINEDEVKKVVPNQLTTFFYAKIYNVDRNNRVLKNIVFKPQDGTSTIDKPGFNWSLNSIKNDIQFTIKVFDEGVEYYDTITVSNVPLMVWTSFACVVEGNKIIIYKNGEYYTSKILRGSPRFSNNPILVGKGFGSAFANIQSFEGAIAGIYISYKTETPDYIRYLHDNAIKSVNTFMPDLSLRCPTAQELEEAKAKINDMYSSVSSTFSQSTATSNTPPM
jgi:hypothetical protein